MKKPILLYLFLFFIFWPHPIFAKKSKCHFKEIAHQDGSLVVSFEIRDFITKDLLEGLRKGMTAAVEFQVQLWRSHRGWMDRLVVEEAIRMRIVYDNWGRCYIVSTREDEALNMNETNLIRFCSEMQNYKLASLEKLDVDKPYYIGVRAVLKPLSIENIQEIKRWLTGEVRNLNPKSIRSVKSPGKKAGNWLVGVMLKLTGFGDRLVQGKSSLFFLKEGPAIVREEE